MIAESLIFTSYKYNLQIIFKGPSNFMIKAHGMRLIWPLNNFLHHAIFNSQSDTWYESMPMGIVNQTFVPFPLIWGEGWGKFDIVGLMGF